MVDFTLTSTAFVFWSLFVLLVGVLGGYLMASPTPRAGRSNGPAPGGKPTYVFKKTTRRKYK